MVLNFAEIVVVDACQFRSNAKTTAEKERYAAVRCDAAAAASTAR
jgi:hypothetical protein